MKTLSIPKLRSSLANVDSAIDAYAGERLKWQSVIDSAPPRYDDTHWQLQIAAARARDVAESTQTAVGVTEQAAQIKHAHDTYADRKQEAERAIQRLDIELEALEAQRQKLIEEIESTLQQKAEEVFGRERNLLIELVREVQAKAAEVGALGFLARGGMLENRGISVPSFGADIQSGWDIDGSNQILRSVSLRDLILDLTPAIRTRLEAMK